ncbi:beta-propeller fold lactonase family protein [Altererythrobacter soli]|uniref:Beta-propeller fold lactonase family protein n=1 Tax=Croceibacterium soli TaxID=1739690 RepID=A0A6I4UQR5_9SPHN|nr:beta-propeller fold lactonase family protein [Croceibacterium soli]MXP41330.1 beta-propeller fold lactonase family protein [Croceibacterium soli]
MPTLHIGTYGKDGGAGLVPLTLAIDGTLACGDAYAEAENASFAASGNGLVYLVDEREEGAVNVLCREGESWRHVARVPSGGEEPCYVSLSPNGRRLAVANYASGSAVLYGLDEAGLPVSPPALFRNDGSGPNAERQEGPHAHCVRFSNDGTALYMVDLGADQVLRLPLTEEGFGEVSVAWTAPAGSGPRHLLFHPDRPLALLLSELAASLTLLSEGPLGFETRQTLSTAPEDFTGENLGGHLVLNADASRVYVSNRGHDSLAVFALADERLELLQHIASGGRHPRHFVLLEDERKLVVAHEKDGCVAGFDVAPDGTLLGPTGSIRVPGACSVVA